MSRNNSNCLINLVNSGNNICGLVIVRKYHVYILDHNSLHKVPSVLIQQLSLCSGTSRTFDLNVLHFKAGQKTWPLTPRRPDQTPEVKVETRHKPHTRLEPTVKTELMRWAPDDSVPNVCVCVCVYLCALGGPTSPNSRISHSWW